MVVKSDKTIKNLIKKVFIEAPGDHHFLEFYFNKKLIARTKISHGANHDLDISLIGKMAMQCWLGKKDFIDLVNCPLSEEKYISILKEKGVIK